MGSHNTSPKKDAMKTLFQPLSAACALILTISMASPALAGHTTLKNVYVQWVEIDSDSSPVLRIRVSGGGNVNLTCRTIEYNITTIGWEGARIIQALATTAMLSGQTVRIFTSTQGPDLCTAKSIRLNG